MKICAVYMALSGYNVPFVEVRRSRWPINEPRQFVLVTPTF